jgi:hypothetical protein
MNYTVYTGSIPFAIESTADAVSPQHAALKVASRLASQGYIPHGKPILLAAIPTLEIDTADYIRVEVTPLGQTWGALEAIRQWTEVAA